MNLRKYKLFNMAIFDFIMTFIIIFILHLYMWFHPLDDMKNQRNIWQYLISLLLFFVSAIGLGVIMHYFFGIKSALSGYLGFNLQPNKNR